MLFILNISNNLTDVKKDKCDECIMPDYAQWQCVSLYDASWHCSSMKPKYTIGLPIDTKHTDHLPHSQHPKSCKHKKSDFPDCPLSA